MAKLLFDRFQEAADRFESAQAAVLQAWSPACGCAEPGLRLECRQCPENQQLQLLTQLKLSDTPETVFPTVAPLPVQKPYPQAVRQQALKLYKQGVALEQIQAETGVTSRHTITKWARRAGLPSRLQLYPAAMHQQALRLYQSGQTPKEIETLLHVPSDTVQGWVHAAGLSRPKKYAPAVKQQCLDFYRQGQTPAEIQTTTGVRAATIRRWVVAAQISRKSGRPQRYPDAVRQHCLLLVQQGKEYREIETLTGVNEATIRFWLRQTKQQQP